MPTQPQIQDPITSDSRAFFVSPTLHGVIALVLIGVASCSLVAAYAANLHAAQVAETAAASVPDPFATIDVQAKSAIVVDMRTGKTLYEKNADAQLPLASLTKVPMALAVSQVLSTDSTITIPYDTAPKGSAERLAKGGSWKVQDVINFTLIASSNEGAQILADDADSAIHTQYPQSPSGDATLWRMNNLVQGLGLTHMYFLNVSGLDESTTQSGAYGTAREVATLFAYAATTSPQIFIGTTRDGMLLSDESGRTTSAFNTNAALGQIPGLIMGKTGYTDLAGGNLAVVFDIGLAHPVVAVVLGSSEAGRFSDMKILVDTARTAVATQ